MQIAKEREVSPHLVLREQGEQKVKEERAKEQDRS